MEGTFGTRLRSQRERQQVPLTVIAERTKIKLSLLEGLERDDVSQWPTGIFRRSFVRAYAHAIGLEPDAVVREFLERYPDPVVEDIPAILAAARENRRPPTRLGCLISSAISAIPAVRAAGARNRLVRGLMSSEEEDEGARIVESERSARSSEPVRPVEVAAPAAYADPGHIQPVRTDIAEVGAVELAAGEPEMRLADALADAIEGSATFSTPLFDSGPDRASAGTEREMSAIASLCSRLAVALHPGDVAPVLEEAARVLRAAGLTLWMWDPATRTLRHVLAHGYSGDLAARLPRVRFDADNAIADAFRSADTRVVSGSDLATGALVVPIVASAGCAGVLALEFQDRGEERESVRALTTIIAAQLASLFGYAPMAAAVGA